MPPGVDRHLRPPLGYTTGYPTPSPHSNDWIPFEDSVITADNAICNIVEYGKRRIP